jgi:hypothetical protein
VKKAVRENGLSIAFLAIFLLALLGQSAAGWRAYNDEQTAHQSPTISYGRYVTSSDFGGKVLENWQSEYLQFTLFILATVWLVQKGSSESKELGEEGGQSDQQQRVGQHAEGASPLWARTNGWRESVYGNSLVIVMTLLFLGSWFGQSLGNWRQYNSEQQEHQQASVSWTRYVTEPDFWDKTLQNWQSEFLAVGSMAIFAVYLRQRGSPESKPVGAPHEETATSS